MKKHEMRDAMSNELYLEWEGHVPRVGDYVQPFEDNHRRTIQVTAVLWMEHKDYRGQLFALIYVRERAFLLC